MKFYQTKIYMSDGWDCLRDDIKNKYLNVEKSLSAAIDIANSVQINLNDFKLNDNDAPQVRPQILAEICGRTHSPYQMTAESTQLKQLFSRKPTQFTSILALANTIRSELLSTEGVRSITVSIKHSPEKRIPIPLVTDPIFREWTVGDSASWLYSALDLYITLITAHPFTDGNGRVSRIAANYVINSFLKPHFHYIPFSELIYQTKGGYEEVLSQCELSGDYESLHFYLLSLIEKYSVFVQQDFRSRSMPILSTILGHMERNKAFNQSTVNPNFRSPFYLSISETLNDEESKHILDIEFLREIIVIWGKVESFGSIIFGITAVNYLIANSGKSKKKVVFIVENLKKELLIGKIRQLREEHENIVIQIAPHHTSAIIYAKHISDILINFKTSEFQEQLDLVFFNQIPESLSIQKK